MIDPKTLADLRDALLRRRRELLDTRNRIQESWVTLQEPEKEMEETALKETLAQGLDQRDQIGQAELSGIDAAISKMQDGTYGICSICGEDIPVERLRALPFAQMCVPCAQAREKLETGGMETPAVVLQNERMNDEEVVESIYDAIRRKGGIETEELAVSCEDGVVYLEGTLSSEAKHQILIELIEDTLGYHEVVDNLVIDRVAWEREERAPGVEPDADIPKTSSQIDGQGDAVDTTLNGIKP
jgi:RNA polymerase-binding transcription factor DksA